MNDNHQHMDTPVDNVTRSQDGQFIDEGGTMFTPDPQLDELAGEGDAQLLDHDADTVRALQVNMERSGAEYVHSQKSFLTNSGAREVHAESARLSNSGVLTLKADTVDMKNSSAVIASTTTATIDDSSKVGVLNANQVEAKGDIRTLFFVGGNTTAGGGVHTTFDVSTAAALGTAFAAALFILGRLFGRK